MIAITIRKPDDVIPFSQLIADLPTFRIQKPSNVKDLKVGYLDKFGEPNFTKIHTTSNEVVSLGDIKEFMGRLNEYIGYIEHHLKERTPERILLELIRTKKGRELVEDVLKNSKFHPELNESVSWKKAGAGE